MKRPFRLPIALRYLILGILTAVVGVNLYTFNAAKLSGNRLPTPFGYGAAVVLSGSMEPKLSTGDLIFVRVTEDYGINDLVVFQDGNTLIVHRLISLDGETAITKGDANSSADDPINISAIKGEVVAAVPAVGRIVNFIKTPIGTICIIAAAVLLLEIPRMKEKKSDDAEKQKIIEEIKRLKEED